LGCGSPQPGDPRSGTQIRIGCTSREEATLSAMPSISLVQSLDASKSTNCEDLIA
jgi:hypothetical protein